MTDKLKGKLVELEKEMVENFNSKLKEKEVEFEEKRERLIFKTKKELLRDISSIFTALVNKRVDFIDNRISDLVSNQVEDFKVISEAIAKKEKAGVEGAVNDINPHCETLKKLEDFFKGDDVQKMMDSENEDKAAIDTTKATTKGKVVFDYDEDGISFQVVKVKGDDKMGTLIAPDKDDPSWNPLFTDGDSLSEGLDAQLRTKKSEFKASIEENLASWMGSLCTAVSQLYNQYSQFHDLKGRLDSFMTSAKLNEKMMTDLATAHTQIVLRTSVEKMHLANQKDDISTKLGNYLLNHMDPQVKEQHQVLYENVIEKLESTLEGESDELKCKKDELEKERDEVTKGCLTAAVHTLFDKREVPLPATAVHVKEMEALREELDLTVAKMVKQVTDEKTNEFEGAKIDLMQQHQLILDEFVAKHEHEMEELKAIYEEDSKTDLLKKLDEMKVKYEEEHIENLGKLQEQIKEDHTEHLRVLAEVQEQQLGEIQTLKTQHTEQLHGIQSQHALEMEKLQKDISMLEENVGKISDGILGELEVLVDLKIPVQYNEDQVSNQSAPFSSSALNSFCRKIQNDVIKHNNSQLDVVHNLFDSALENASSKICLSNDSFNSELLLTEKESSKSSLAEIKESIVRPTIHEEIENTFKQLQDDYETWYKELTLQLASRDNEINQVKQSAQEAQEMLKEQAVEIEALKCSVTNQHANMEQLKEQVIKKQMLLDAKECQLIEMEEQTKKDHQKHTLRLEEISEEKLKEVKEVNGFLEEKLLLISQLEEQSAKQTSLVGATEKQLLELTTELQSQKEQHASEYQQMLTDKGNEIAAAYKQLEDTVKGKDALEELIKTQEAAMTKLQDELQEFNELNSTKEAQMMETEQELRREIAILESNAMGKDKELVHIHNTLNDSVVRVSELNDEVSRSKDIVQKLEDELVKTNDLLKDKQHAAELLEAKLDKEASSLNDSFVHVNELSEELARNKNLVGKLEEELSKANLLLEQKQTAVETLEAKLENEVNSLNDSFAQVNELNDEVEKNRDIVEKLGDEITSYNKILSDKQGEIENLEAKLLKEREEFASELLQVAGNKDQEISAIQAALNESIEEKNELEKLKEKFTNDLKDISESKGREISAIYKELEGKLKEKDGLEDLVKKQNFSICQLQEELTNMKRADENREKGINEKEEHLKRKVENMTNELEENKTLLQLTIDGKHAAEKLKSQLQENVAKCEERAKECERIVELKEEECIQLREDLMVEKGKFVLEFDKLTAAKNEELHNFQAALNDISRQKDEVEDLVNLKQTYINELEAQLKEIQREKIENGEELEEVIKRQLSDIGELSKEKKDCREKIEEKEIKLNEMEKALAAAHERFAQEIEDLMCKKTEEIIELQQELEKVAAEGEELREYNRNNDAVIDKLQEEFNDTEELVLQEKQEHEAELDRLRREQEQQVSALQYEVDRLKELTQQNNNEVDAVQKEMERVICNKDEEKERDEKHIGNLEEQISNMTKQLESEKQSHLVHLETLRREKADDLTALHNELTKRSREMAEMALANDSAVVEISKEKEDLVDHVALLEHQLTETRDILDAKQAELSRVQDKLLEELERSTGLHDLSMDRCEEVAVLQTQLSNLNSQLHDLELKHGAEKERHHAEVLKLMEDHRDQAKSLTSLQANLSSEKAQMENVLNKQQTYISELEEQVKASKEYMDEKMEQLDNIEVQLEEEKVRHADDLTRLRADIDKLSASHEQDLAQKIEEIDELQLLIESKNQQLGSSDASQVINLKKEVNELTSQLKRQEREDKSVQGELKDLRDQIVKQQGLVKEVETKLEAHQLLLEDKKQEVSDLKKQIADERNEHITAYENMATKQKETQGNMEVVLQAEIAEKEELKNYVKSLETLTGELNSQLDDQKQMVASKEKSIADMQALHEKLLEKRNFDLEQIALQKSDLERSFEDEMGKRDEITSLVRQQEAVIENLEKELGVRDSMSKEMRETLEKEVQQQEAANNSLSEKLNEKERVVAEQEKFLEELNKQHSHDLNKLKCDFDAATEQREEQIIVLEKNIEVQMKETDELKDIVKRQQALVCELDQQLSQAKNENNVHAREAKEIQDNITSKANTEVSELKSELAHAKEMLKETEKALRDAGKSVAEKQNETLQLEEELATQNNDFIEEKEKMLKEHTDHIGKIATEKEILVDTVNKLEEKLLNSEYEIKAKTEQLGELQKAQQEMQLEHISEIMKLNNEHRQQVGSLMEIPQKDRNIKSLLLDLQKEADEVLDLVVNVPDINDKPSREQIDYLKATWEEEKQALLEIIDDLRKNVKDSAAVSTANMSTEGLEDFPHDHIGEISIASMASMASNLKHGGTESQATESGQGYLVHDDVAEKKQLAEKLEDEARLRKDLELAHDAELVKAAEREQNLKDKYLKVAELLQKEKNEKSRLMDMLNDAQQLNEIQSQSLEDVQNNKNSLLESYSLITELENMLSKEREKGSLLNTKMENLQEELKNEKEDLIATKERERSLKDKCRELGQLFENETELRKNIADALDSEKKMILIEKRNLQQKEISLNQKVAEFGTDNFAEKYKSLKTWETELKKREKAVMGKENGYDIIPQKQSKEERLRDMNGDDLLDVKHLPLVADLNEKIRSLQEDKAKLLENLNTLKDEIIDYKKQLKEYQHERESKTDSDDREINGLEADKENGATDGQKLLNAGWTIAKVQRLYLKYFRAESFRKALVYQKRYLTLMLTENEVQVNGGALTNWLALGNGAVDSSGRRKVTFKVVVLAVISIRRMKYLVKKYHRNLHKSSPQYQFKDKVRNTSKKKGVENVIDEDEPSPVHQVKDTKPAPKSAPLGKNHSPKKPSPRVANAKSSLKYPDLTPHKHSSEPSNNTQTLNPTTRPTNGFNTNFSTPCVDENQNIPGLDTYMNGVPRSYPRPSALNTDDNIVKHSRANEDTPGVRSTPGRTDKSPYSNPFASNPSPLLSSTSRDMPDGDKEDANESLSNYIHTLETLQNRLKKVGGYTTGGTATRTSLL